MVNKGSSALSVSLLLLSVQLALGQVCNIHCDGRDPAQGRNSREAVSAEIFGRQIRLFISDEDNMGFAEISNGDPTDEVWIDRSWNAGRAWDGKLGDTVIPSGSRNVRTLMYNVDNPSERGIGALRACGKPGNRDEIACTPWARSTVNAETHVDAAATALMQFFDGKLFATTGWWNGANCLNALFDYFLITGSRNYWYVMDVAYERNKNDHFGDYTNDYIDDTLWWGLAWTRAYELTGEQKYLETAKHTADYCYEGYRDDTCGGGLWWRIQKDYKNAITNELFIKLAAALHNQIPGDTKYFNQAVEVWNWLKGSGMFNSENLINDGLRSDCTNNGQMTWTYNQGVVLGGLAELYKATNNRTYLDEAIKIADAVIASNNFNPDGVLREFGCGNGDCGVDGPTFKGVFVRNLGELNRILDGKPYSAYLQNQAESNWGKNRNELNQFGLRWEGPIDKLDAARQQSAFETFVAAI